MTSRAGKRLCDDAGRVGLDGARAQMVLQTVAGGGISRADKKRKRDLLRGRNVQTKDERSS
jgi:hypothetical protein